MGKFIKWNILLFLSNSFSQDTLRYKYIPAYSTDSSFSHNVLQYFVEDSIFIIDKLFGGSLKYYFKVKDGQWFMKHDSTD